MLPHFHFLKKNKKKRKEVNLSVFDNEKKDYLPPFFTFFPSLATAV